MAKDKIKTLADAEIRIEALEDKLATLELAIRGEFPKP